MLRILSDRDESFQRNEMDWTKQLSMVCVLGDLEAVTLAALMDSRGKADRAVCVFVTLVDGRTT